MLHLNSRTPPNLYKKQKERCSKKNQQLSCPPAQSQWTTTTIISLRSPQLIPISLHDSEAKRMGYRDRDLLLGPSKRLLCFHSCKVQLNKRTWSFQTFLWHVTNSWPSSFDTYQACLPVIPCSIHVWGQSHTWGQRFHKQHYAQCILFTIGKIIGKKFPVKVVRPRNNNRSETFFDAFDLDIFYIDSFETIQTFETEDILPTPTSALNKLTWLASWEPKATDLQASTWCLTGRNCHHHHKSGPIPQCTSTSPTLYIRTKLKHHS